MEGAHQTHAQPSQNGQVQSAAYKRQRPDKQELEQHQTRRARGEHAQDRDLIELENVVTAGVKNERRGQKGEDQQHIKQLVHQTRGAPRGWVITVSYTHLTLPTIY